MCIFIVSFIDYTFLFIIVFCATARDFSSSAAQHVTDEQVAMLGAVAAPRARMRAHFPALLVDVPVQRSLLRVDPAAVWATVATAPWAKEDL